MYNSIYFIDELEFIYCRYKTKTQTPLPKTNTNLKLRSQNQIYFISAKQEL